MNHRIEIEKDIVVFGWSIPKGSQIICPSDLTNTGSNVLIIHYENKNGETCDCPINCKEHYLTAIDFLDKIVKLNSNHNSFYEYVDSENFKLFGYKK
jgi:hypothetical protein